MSFGGILATALAGGAGAIGKQAGDDIESQRKADMLKQQADIEFQTQQRLAEMRQRMERDQTLWKTQGDGGTATLDFNRRDLEQRNDLAIKGKVAEATNPELVAAKAAEAEAELQRDIRKIRETAKPEAEKAAAIAEARARAEAKYRKADPTIAGKMADMEKALGRPLNEQERLAALGLAPKGRDPELDTVTVEETTGEIGGPQTKTTRKEVRKPGNGAAKADGAPPVGTEVGGYVFKGGDPNDKKNWAPKADSKPGMIPNGAKAADDSNDRTIRRVAQGYGTAFYRYAGKNYPTQQAAEAAKAEWDSLSADDYFKTPN